VSNLETELLRAFPIGSLNKEWDGGTAGNGPRG
jgi:hypothetical protein